MQLKQVAILAANHKRCGIGRMPKNSIDFRLEEDAVQEASLCDVPNDERLVVTTTRQIDAIEGEGEVIYRVAMATVEGVYFDVGASPARHDCKVRLLRR